MQDATGRAQLRAHGERSDHLVGIDLREPDAEQTRQQRIEHGLNSGGV